MILRANILHRVKIIQELIKKPDENYNELKNDIEYLLICFSLSYIDVKINKNYKETINLLTDILKTLKNTDNEKLKNIFYLLFALRDSINFCTYEFKKEIGGLDLKMLKEIDFTEYGKGLYNVSIELGADLNLD